MTTNNNYPQIGAFVLETLTTGMYRNPLDALREYIQNAFDSIREAERKSVIKNGAGRINISISEEEKLLRLRDNGLGIKKDEIKARLVNIGMSEKSLNTDAGFRGIGRLAGIAYCDKLVFKTQNYDEKELSTVTFDAHALKEAIAPTNRKVEQLASIIDKYVTVTTEKVRKNDHFLELSMQGINTSGELFLSLKKIRTYLEQVAPLPLDTQSFHYSKEFYDWIDKTGVSLPEVSIILECNNTYELFKPYKKITYSTVQNKHKVHINGLRFFPENATKDSPFWIWYTETNCPGAIGDDTVAGLRLRKSNIALGLSERMSEVFRMVSESYARFNKYFMGEVHIQDHRVIPNAHRDDFEETPEWIAIKQELIKFAKERSREAHSLSNGRNADIGKLLSTADKHLDEILKKQQTGFASKAEKEKIASEITKHVTKLESAEKADRSDEERKRLARKKKELVASQYKIFNETNFITQNLKTSLNKKQKKIISDIIEILYDVLDEHNFETARDAILNKFQIPQ